MTPTEDPAVVAARLDKYDQKAATLVRQMKAEHEAFRREVSEACNGVWDLERFSREIVRDYLSRFIIKPVDPLVEQLRVVMRKFGHDLTDEQLFAMRDEALAARGGKIVFEEQAR